jgi:hypothetical protein
MAYGFIGGDVGLWDLICWFVWFVVGFVGL